MEDLEGQDNHNIRHQTLLTHSFMSVGGGVGVDEDTGATCLVPEAHLIVDGPASIVFIIYFPYKLQLKSQVLISHSHLNRGVLGVWGFGLMG